MVSRFHHFIQKGAASRSWFWVAATIWLLAAASGLGVLWAYDNAPGESAVAPSTWPVATALTRAEDGPTLVMLAHPQCSCTRASLDELAEALARATVQPKTYVLFLKPDGVSDDWTQSDLWRVAAAIPHVTVVRDDEGAEAQRFGVSTSGQTLLYDADGALVFSGGITGARAHRGDNAGRQAIVDLLNNGTAAPSTTNVFGCRLFTSGL